MHKIIYLKLINKIANGKSPNYLQEKLIKVRQIHNRNTRQIENFYIPLCNKESTKQLLLVNGLKIYNNVVKEYENYRENSNVSMNKFILKFVKENYVN